MRPRSCGAWRALDAFFPPQLLIAPLFSRSYLSRNELETVPETLFASASNLRRLYVALMYLGIFFFFFFFLVAARTVP